MILMKYGWLHVLCGIHTFVLENCKQFFQVSGVTHTTYQYDN